MSKINRTTPEGKGLRTFAWSVVGVFVAFVVGLWEVPGVPEYIINFVQSRGVELFLWVAGLVGVPAGFTSYIVNRIQDK